MEYYSNNKPNLLGTKVENVIKEIHINNQPIIPKYNIISGGSTVSDKISTLLYSTYTSIIHPNLLVIIIILIMSLFLFYRYYAKTDKNKQENYEINKNGKNGKNGKNDINNKNILYTDENEHTYDNSTIFTASEPIIDPNKYYNVSKQYEENIINKKDNIYDKNDTYMAYNEQNYYDKNNYDLNNGPAGLLPNTFGFEIQPPYSH